MTPAEIIPPFADNRIGALHRLKAAGYKIGKSKLYADAQSGLLQVEDDGSITEKSIKRYLKLAQLKRLSESTAGDPAGDKLAVERAKKELEKLDEQIKKARHENEVNAGLYILKSDFALEMAARAGVFDTGLKNLIRTRAGEWIRTVSGDPEKSADLINCMEMEVERLLRDYSDIKRFQVVFI